MKIRNYLRLFYQKSWPVYLFITALIFFVWHKVLNQTFLGEGYFYFNEKLYLIKGWNFPYLGDYDNFAKLFFQLITPIFKDNVRIYFFTELFIVVTFFYIFYFVINKITKSKFVAFVSTVFISTNYLALFEYLGAGNYQRFIQRFPNLIPLMIAFYFLWKFNDTKKKGYLIYSLLIYSLALIMGHFSALMLPLFLIYSSVVVLAKKINLKNLLLTFLICSLYIFITYFLTRYSFQKPNYSLVGFLKTEPNILWRILYQIPIITFPLGLLKYISLKSTFVISVSFYLFGGYVIFKRLSKLKSFYITCFLSMLGVMFTYLYTDPRLDVTKSLGEDRYYLLSSLFAVVIWAMILKALFIKHSKGLLITSTVILTSFVVYNTSLVWGNIDKIQYQSQMYKVFIGYFKDNKMNIREGSVVVAPYYLTFSSPLISSTILDGKGVEFVLPSAGWEKAYRKTKGRVYVFDYDNGNPWKDSYNPMSGKLIDLTSQYRQGKKIHFTN